MVPNNTVLPAWESPKVCNPCVAWGKRPAEVALQPNSHPGEAPVVLVDQVRFRVHKMLMAISFPSPVRMGPWQLCSPARGSSDSGRVWGCFMGAAVILPERRQPKILQPECVSPFPVGRRFAVRCESALIKVTRLFIQLWWLLCS